MGEGKQMKQKTQIHDIVVRLPKNKKYLKQKLLEICSENTTSLNRLMIYVIEFYLKIRDRRPF